MLSTESLRIVNVYIKILRFYRIIQKVYSV